MKAIMVMFDSLNRHMLPYYGCDWVQVPNFQRLSEQNGPQAMDKIYRSPCSMVSRRAQ